MRATPVTATPPAPVELSEPALAVPPSPECPMTSIPVASRSLAEPPHTLQPPSLETREAIHDLFERSRQDLSEEQQQQLEELLQAFVFAAKDEECTHTNLVLHDIETGNARPIRLRLRRLPLANREAAQQKIEEMWRAGIIEPSNSPWAAPAVLVRKKDGTWRFCVDYRRLNAVTCKDSYLLPRIDDALDYISGSSWFSSLDLRSGYWQVELIPEARPKTAFSIGRRLWQFKVMPFGLCNAPATFKRLMEGVMLTFPATAVWCTWMTSWHTQLTSKARSRTCKMFSMPSAVLGYVSIPRSATCSTRASPSWAMLSAARG